MAKTIFKPAPEAESDIRKNVTSAPITAAVSC